MQALNHFVTGLDFIRPAAQSQRIGNVFFIRFAAVFIHFALILGSVRQAACAADAAARTGHAFDEILLEQILLLLEQRHTALFNAITHNGIGDEINLLLL